jgi:hypothetical protein
MRVLHESLENMKYSQNLFLTRFLKFFTHFLKLDKNVEFLEKKKELLSSIY